MQIPQKLAIANTPTPIENLERLLPDKTWANLYVKRDDFTGFETSGNKVRKFEYHLKKAFDEKAEVLITCGGFQSNHARVAASLAARFSMGCHLVLRESGTPGLTPDGNYLFDRLFGAKIQWVNEQQYKDERNEIMKDAEKKYQLLGKKTYIMPEGGSDGYGLFGYFSAYQEILQQEQELGIHFDAICVADGSGGTYAGLYMANELLGGRKRIIGFNIYGPKPTAVHIEKLLLEGAKLAGLQSPVSGERIRINSDYLGEGYGAVSQKLVEFIKSTASKTGIVLDPVYTGKALMGTVSEIEKHNLLLKGNVLFIHTGGQFGLFPYKELFR